jgi:hypothetical protein
MTTAGAKFFSKILYMGKYDKNINFQVINKFYEKYYINK